MEVLFINFNYADMLNQYLTNVFIVKINLYNLYFNIKEKGSNIQKNLEEDILNFNEFYLNLALLIKKIGGYPIMNLDENKRISTIKEISSKDYTANDINSILLNNFKVISNMNKQVFEYALKKYDLSSINLVLDFNKYLGKRVGELQNS